MKIIGHPHIKIKVQAQESKTISSFSQISAHLVDVVVLVVVVEVLVVVVEVLVVVLRKNVQ